MLSSTSDVTEPPDVYEITLAPPARRAITSKLPPDVAAAAVDFITGPLIGNPKRLGKPLRAPLDGTWSARLMRNWRVLYEIDEEKHEVLVVDIRHRADAYRRLPAPLATARERATGIDPHDQLGRLRVQER